MSVSSHESIATSAPPAEKRRLAFLSYRRGDTGDAARAIYAQLKRHFGSGQLFMDVNSIAPGQTWPTRIRDQLDSATLVLALIGKKWFRARDEWGRRRIDSPDDWVALEIKTALKKGVPVVPVIIGSKTPQPDLNAFPEELRGISVSQSVQIHDGQSWPACVDTLVKTCRNQFHLVERLELADRLRPPGDPKKKEKRATESAELTEFLRSASGWEPWEDSLWREYPAKRQELKKNFTFSNFKVASDFMTRAAELFERKQHHPRWSNEWGLVTIALSTWDAGNIVTSYDLEVARDLDKLYGEYEDSRPPAAAKSSDASMVTNLTS